MPRAAPDHLLGIDRGGLSQAQAKHRLEVDGPNALPDPQRHSVWGLLGELLREPMLALLMACGVVYLALGDAAEAALLIGFSFVVIAVTLFQRQRAEHALAALREIAAPRALVIRAGEQLRIAASELVVGDWFVLAEGDRIPADGILVKAEHFAVDESALTGESVPADKAIGMTVSAATLAVSGRAIAQVTATGPRTAIGQIGSSLLTSPPSISPLQRQTQAQVRRLALVVGLLCVLMALVWGLTRGDWIAGFLGALALAMALLPQEFPVVLTVFLALGAVRLAQQKVLVRRLAAIETLGSVGVLCVDKTGTLTENRMAVQSILPLSLGVNPPTQPVLPGQSNARCAPADPHESIGAAGEPGASAQPVLHAQEILVANAVWATRTDPFDPTERAIHALRPAPSRPASPTDRVLVHAYPLSVELLAMSQVWEDPLEGTRHIAAKGAPEAIAHLCHLDALQSAAMAREVEAMASQGLRVLAVARAVETHSGGILSPDSPMPARAHDFAFEFLGLLGLADPVREGVPAAVAECLGAGIRVLMITGDHPATALAIARQAGIPSTNLLTGAAMDALDDLTLAQRLRDTCVVARATPMHKLRIVRALRAQGWVVGMTGDGINDAPALRAADVGVAMGRRGTDVAREAADLVLAEDDFGALVGAVREGRRIFDNLRSATAYLIAVHLPIAVLAMAPLLLGGPLMLMPAHIAFLELVIDPACALVFQALALSSQAMRQPPRTAQTGLFERAVLGRALAGGFLATLFCALVWWGAQWLGWREEDIRAATFASLVFGNLGLIVFYRGGLARPGLTFPLVCFGALAALAAVLTIAPLARLFRVG